MTLALLASVSATPNDCTGGQCEGSSDSNVLIQNKVQVSEPAHSLERHHQRLPGNVQELLGQVEHMLKENADPTRPRTSLAKIGEIKDLVEKELLPDLQATHDAAQQELNTFSAKANTCNQDGTNNLQQVADTDEASTSSARLEHKSSRRIEASHHAVKTEKCGALTEFLTGIVLPATLPDGDEPSAMGPYLKSMSEFFCPPCQDGSTCPGTDGAGACPHACPDGQSRPPSKHQRFVSLNGACNNATAVHDAQVEVANRAQAKFELDFCTWRTRLTDICSTGGSYPTCYNAAVQEYRTSEAETKVLEEKWHTEYAGMKKISCYIDVWMNNNDATSVDSAQLDQCKSGTVDTSPMNITYPGVPCAIACDEAPVANYPGTSGFLPEYTFSDISAAAAPVNDVNSCMPASGGTALGLLETAAVDYEDDAEDEDEDDEDWEAVAPAQAAAGQITVDPFPCSSHPEAVQVVGNKATRAYDVKALNVNTGVYTDIYSIPSSRTKPAFKSLNSCGINPKDSIMYCIMRFGPGGFLVRIDATKVAFVKAVHGKKESSNAAGFDEDGTFFFNKFQKAKEASKKLVQMDNVAAIPGFSSPKAALKNGKDALTAQGVSLAGVPMVGDVVPIKTTLQGGGEATYVLGLMKGGRLLVAKMGAAPQKWQLDTSHNAADTHFYGAGWNFQGRVFFATNSGEGVYEISMPTINLETGTQVSVGKNCNSATTASNDGVNCMTVPAPFQDTPMDDQAFGVAAAAVPAPAPAPAATGNCFNQAYTASR